VKFLVDAQLPRRLALWLQQRGHDVIPHSKFCQPFVRCRLDGL
jgi:predicted nuclease of predicted toxin-antitoxin system